MTKSRAHPVKTDQAYYPFRTVCYRCPQRTNILGNSQSLISQLNSDQAEQMPKLSRVIAKDTCRFAGIIMLPGFALKSNKMPHNWKGDFIWARPSHSAGID